MECFFLYSRWENSLRKTRHSILPLSKNTWCVRDILSSNFHKGQEQASQTQLESLQRYFVGDAFDVGSGWTGDLLVADASKVYVKRFKEIDDDSYFFVLTVQHNQHEMVAIVMPPTLVDLIRIWLKISNLAKEKTLSKRNMISGASLEASFTDATLWTGNTYGFEKNLMLFDSPNWLNLDKTQEHNIEDCWIVGLWTTTIWTPHWIHEIDNSKSRPTQRTCVSRKKADQNSNYRVACFWKGLHEAIAIRRKSDVQGLPPK